MVAVTLSDITMMSLAGLMLLGIVIDVGSHSKIRWALPLFVVSAGAMVVMLGLDVFLAVDHATRLVLLAVFVVLVGAYVWARRKR